MDYFNAISGDRTSEVVGAIWLSAWIPLDGYVAIGATVSTSSGCDLEIFYSLDAINVATDMTVGPVAIAAGQSGSIKSVVKARYGRFRCQGVIGTLIVNAYGMDTFTSITNAPGAGTPLLNNDQEVLTLTAGVGASITTTDNDLTLNMTGVGPTGPPASGVRFHVFNARGTAGATRAIATNTVIGITTEVINTDPTLFTFTNPSVVTINRAISALVTVDVSASLPTSGGAPPNLLCIVTPQLDVGGGYSEIAGTRMYCLGQKNQVSFITEASCSQTFAINFSAGDKIRVIASKTHPSYPMNNIEQGSGISILQTS